LKKRITGIIVQVMVNVYLDFV
jgi:hypothetical protein